MANPIKVSDLIKNEGELKQLLAELEAIQAKLKELAEGEIKNAKNLVGSVSKLNVVYSQQREEIEETAKQANEIEKRYNKYNASLTENAQKIAALQVAQTKLNQINKLEAKINISKEGSYNRLSAQYSLNKLRLNQMSAAERKNTKEGKELVKTTNEIYQEMKQLQEATGKHVLSVGDYGKATEGLLGQLDEMPGALGQASQGVRGLGQQFKKLLRNPIVLLIAAIVAALATLGRAFTTTERGAKLLDAASGALEGALSTLAKISNSVADALTFAFEKPKEAASDLWEFLKQNYINRFKAIPKLFQTAGALIIDNFKLIGQAAKLAFAEVPLLGAGIDKEQVKKNIRELQEAVVDGLEDLGQEGIQLAIGLDKDQQKEALDAIKDEVEEIIKVGAEFAKLEQQRRHLAKTTAALRLEVEKLTTAEEIQNQIADDATLGFEKQKEANLEAARIAELRSKKELDLAKASLSIINAELKLRRAHGQETTALQAQQLEGLAGIEAAERAYTLTVARSAQQRRQIKSDELEQDLDFLIDVSDARKMVAERQLRDESLSFNQRREILNKTRADLEDSFKRQAEIIKQFAGETVDLNEIINASDTETVRAKAKALGLSEVITNRLLEIVRERIAANQDLADAEKDLARAEIKAAKDAELAKASRIKKEHAAQLQAFKFRQDFAKSEFDLLEKTEKEKTDFKLNAEKDRLRKILELNKEFGNELSDVQIATIKNQIQKINQLLAESKPPQDIYDLFGFSLKEETKTALNEAIGYVKEQFSALADSRVQLADQMVASADREVQAAQKALDDEIAKRRENEANNVQSAQRLLDNAKKNQEKALKEQEKAQKAQRRIQTLEQTTNLITATTKIWGALGGIPFLALAAIGTMWGSFIANKARAAKLTKKQFAKGGLEIVGGGSHASGNDTYMGFSVDGQPAYAEQGEAHMILSKSATNRYKAVLPSIFDSLKKGTFENVFGAPKTDTVVIQQGSSGYSEQMESDISAMRRNSDKVIYQNKDGHTVEVDGYRTTIYVN